MAEFYGPGPRTEQNVASLDILTYDGARFSVGPTDHQQLDRILQAGGRQAEIYRSLIELRDRYADLIRARYPKIPRRVSGYNLEALLPENGFNVAEALVGTEGTCVAILGATVKLMEAPNARTLLVLGYPDVYQAADHVMQIRAHKPIGLEGIDEKLIDYMRRKGVHPGDIKLLPEGQGWLLVEFGGATRDESDSRAKDLMADLKKLSDAPTMKLFEDAWEEHKMWEVRESGLAATAHVPNMREAYPGWEDAAVPPEEVGNYLREFRSLLQEFNYDCSLYGHFGQGCIHCRITFDLKTNEGIQTYMRFINRAGRLGRQARRGAVRRAWRRPSPCRLARKNVRPGAGRCLSPVQIDLGSRRKDEPGQSRRSLSAGRQLEMESTELPSGDGRNPLSLSERSRLVCPSGQPLRGRWQVSAGRRRHDVPQLYGDPRRDILHARPRASAV